MVHQHGTRKKNAPTLEAPGQSAFPEGLFRSRERQPKNCVGRLLVPLLRPIAIDLPEVWRKCHHAGVATP
jgi:hypothetical protein